MDINEVKGKDCISIDLSYPSCIDNSTGLKPSLIHRCTQSALAGRMISETWLTLLPHGWLWVLFSSQCPDDADVIVQSDDAINASFLQ